MFKVDCFAAGGKNSTCGITRRKSCARCRFYKNRDEYRRGFLAGKERLDRMGLTDAAKNKYILFAEMCRKVR